VSGEKFIKLDAELYRYLLRHGHNHDPLLEELVRETAALGSLAAMQVTPEEGTLLNLLVRVTGARRALEVGTFTGFSSLCIARALPEDGRLLCCEVNEQFAAVARRFWQKAGVAHKVELALRPAVETLRMLEERPAFDFVFIDADKPNYLVYYEEALKRTKPNGLIVIDNVLWGGKVVERDDQSEDCRAIRALNEFIARDDRVQAVMLPVADGITLARKK